MKISKIKPIFIPQLFILITIFFLFLFLPKKALATMYDTGAGCCIEPPGCNATELHNETKSCQSDSFDPNAYCNTTTHTCWATLTSPLQKFQKELTECDKTGTMNLSCFMAGTGDVNPNGFQGIFGSLANTITLSIIGTGSANLQTNPQLPFNRGAIGTVANLINEIYTNPPASSVEYIADIGRNMGIARPAYAQGYGFSQLSNILPLWKTFRNLAYIFFIIVFLVIGLAIMFRVKISPQAVTTIQSAIPKAIIALVLTTFSYAIAGFLIDLIYLVITLGVVLFAPLATQSQSVSFWQSHLTGLSFNEAFEVIMAGGTRAIVTSVSALLGFTSDSGIGGVITKAIYSLLFGSNPVITLVLSIIVFFLVVKLFFSLLLIYIQIILAIIFAPIQIMLGALPGTKGGFGSWARNLFANLMVFPAVALFLLLANILGGQYGPKWTPPVLGIKGNIAPSLIALGMLLLITKVPGMVKSALGMKEGREGFGTGIGEAFGPAKKIGRVGFYVGAGEIAGPGGKLDIADKKGLAMALRKILGMK